MRESREIKAVLSSITSCLHRANAFKWKVMVVPDPQSASLLQRIAYYRDLEGSEEILAAGRLGGFGIGDKQEFSH